MRRLAVAFLALAALLVACGGEAMVAVPEKVPDGLVPQTVQNNELAFYESEEPGVKEAFGNAGPQSLAADGRLWELRKGDRLVGALQLATLIPDVDLEERKQRDQILRQVMPAVVDELQVDELRVWTTTSNDKTTYLWFGRQMFVVLSLKGGEDELDAEGILNDVVAHTTSSDAWDPLYIDEDEEEKEREREQNR